MRQNLVEAPVAVKRFREYVKPHDVVDPLNQHWRGTLPELMSEIGFESLGIGENAVVFGHPTYPYVIKIFMKDTAYLRWVSFCMRHPRNRYVPKIRGKVIRITESVMAIRMEKLHRRPTTMDYEYVAKLYEQADEYGEADANEVVEYLEDNNSLLDLHNGNFLFDTKGQMKLIDPFYNYYRGGIFTINPNDLSKLTHVF